MKFIIVICSFLMGLIGLFLDQSYFPNSGAYLLTISLFLTPSIFVLGDIYNKISKLTKDEKKEMKEHI